VDRGNPAKFSSQTPPSEQSDQLALAPVIKKERYFPLWKFMVWTINWSLHMTFDPTLQPHPPEEVVRLHDAESGLSGVIVLHSSRLGPAAGGCRLWRYDSAAEATIDAVRLAEGMSYKNAMAGLPLGGGKAVLSLPDGAIDRAALFRAFGRAVASLGGRYVTAEDVGTSVRDMMHVAETTRHVAGLPPKPGAPGGDPSPWTALGVFRAMELAVRRLLGAGIGDVTVAVQGLGHVGYALCELLHESGARLIVAEPRTEIAAAAAAAFGAEVRAVGELVAADADVFAPCALGAVVDQKTARTLRAKIVCGAANNQLATPQQGATLAERGILYAPDYIVNAGGIINVAAEYLGWSRTEAQNRVEAIPARLAEVLDFADSHGLVPHAAADTFARSIIATRGVAPVAA
jgi:leucine dehydrogenase